jgi:hypothetical protein
MIDRYQSVIGCSLKEDLHCGGGGVNNQFLILKF